MQFGKTMAALGAGAMLLTACGGAAAAGNTSTTAASKATVQKAIKNGVIVDGLFEEPNLLNPILGPSMTYAGMVGTTLFRNMFATLPSGKLQPDLATVVPTLANGGISKNGLVYTFHIKPNANWSNGQPVTSQDVITTWKLITNPVVTAWSTVGWTDVKSVVANSPKEFTVTLDKPFAPLLLDVFGGYPAILPSSVFGKMSPAQVDKAAFNHDPTVSDGPFMFKNWVPGSSITVVANPRWYGPKPKASEIIFKVIPSDNTLLANAQAHAINVYYFDPIEQVKQLEAISGATVHFTTQPAWESAVVNSRSKLLSNPKVRQALEMAINRQALANKVWQGHATAIGGPAAPDEWSYNPALKPWPYNPTKAKKMLESLGWKMGSNGYLQKGGKTFSIIYATTAGNPWREASERLIQFWFKQIGVQMVIHNEPANAYFGTMLPSGKGWDLGEYQWGNGADPAAGLESQWECGASENFGAYCNKQLDTLLKSQDSLVAQNARQAVLFKAMTIFHNTLPNLWYYSPAEIDTSINMAGYTPNPFSFDTWNAYAWQQLK